MLASLNQAYGRAAREPWQGKKQQQTAAPAPEAPPEEPPPAPPTRKHFISTANAVFHVDEETGAKSFVCSRLEVEAYARDPNSEAWGRRLKWNDADGKEHSWIVPMRMLVGDCVAFRETLADGGLEIGSGPKVNDRLTQYVRSQRPERSIICVPHVGWLDRAFIFPESVIPPDANVGYQTAGRGEHFYRTSGTLESWREQIGRRCAGNSRLIFAVSAAFAGPLLRPLNVQGGGFHFRSFSSMGKSTTQWVAGSVWGGGGRNGFARTWAATKNAIESVAELHNDGCLILDEIRMIDPREVEPIVYMLANGSGKSRENRNLTGRRTLQWLCMVLSSGEIPLADCAALAGQKIKGGAEIRLVTVPAEAGAGMGVFEKLHDTSDPRVFAETLEAQAKRNYGTPIRRFLECLIGNWEDEIQSGIEFIDAFIQHSLPAEAAPEIRRVLRRFAVTAYAGEIATQHGITGWEENEATSAAITCFKDWLKERGFVEPTDSINALLQVRQILATQHGRFCPAEPGSDDKANAIYGRISNILGYRKEIDGEVIYLVDQDAFRSEVCAGYDHREVAKELARRKLLLVNQMDRQLTYRTEVTPPQGGKQRRRFIAVRAKILET
jgi:uncharacterized protein (DUF927 family)